MKTEYTNLGTTFTMFAYQKYQNRKKELFRRLGNLNDTNMKIQDLGPLSIS